MKISESGKFYEDYTKNSVDFVLIFRIRKMHRKYSRVSKLLITDN